MTTAKPLRPAVRSVVKALHARLVQTCPDVTIQALEQEARRLLAGQRPQGELGVRLLYVLYSARFITQMPM